MSDRIIHDIWYCYSSKKHGTVLALVSNRNQYGSKKMKKMILSAIILLWGTSAAFAQIPDMRTQRPASREEAIARYLNLTEKQKGEIRELRLQFKKEMMPLKDQIGQLKTERKLEMTSFEPNRQNLTRIVNESSEIIKDVQIKTIDLTLNIRSMLNE